MSDKRLFCGVGLNDADYNVKNNVIGEYLVCPFYKTWSSMLNRCYSKSYESIRPRSKGSKVCREWHIFSNFKSWMQKQDWLGNCLDKDILRPGNKLYSPNNCIFVSNRVNTIFNDRGSKRGKYPQGVIFNKEKGKYTAQISILSKKIHLGYFNNLNEASQAYKKAKYEEVVNVANKQKEVIVKKALLNHAELFRINHE